MPRYRVHFVDHGERVFDLTEVEHDTDEVATEYTHRLEVPSIGAGFDVWHDERPVDLQARRAAVGPIYGGSSS